MSKPYIFSLDLGTSFTKAVAALPSSNEGRIQIVGAISIPAIGMRRGVIVDSAQVAKNIRIVLSQMKSSLGVDPEQVIVNVSGDHLGNTTSKGVVTVSRADGMISEQDVERVIHSSQSVSLPPNREIVQVVPREFSVDGERRIKNAVGMNGIRLEVESFIVYAFSPHLKTLMRTLSEAGVEMSGSAISSLAASSIVLSEKQKEIGTMLLDIGAQTTDIAVFEEGQPIYIGVLPVGSFHISNDIAIMVRIDPELAERIKIEFGSCFPQEISKKEIITGESLGSSDDISVSRKDISQIMEARLEEIFELVNKELRRVGKEAALPGGVVLTGGGSKIARLAEFAKRELRLPVRLGNLQNGEGLVGRIDELQFATAAGLAMLGLETSSRQAAVFEKTSSFGKKLKGIFENLLP